MAQGMASPRIMHHLPKDETQQQCLLLEDTPSSWHHAHGGGGGANMSSSSNNNTINISSAAEASIGILPLPHHHHHHHHDHYTISPPLFLNQGVLLYILAWSVLVGLTTLLVLLMIAMYQRFATRRRLEKCRLPTVYWRPRFVNYQPSSLSSSSFSSSLSSPPSLNDKETKCLSSSNITNILPRMQRLKGPFGMYGTVYGLSTAVVHIAHPIPAAAVLSLTTTTATTTTTGTATNSGATTSTATNVASASSNARQSSSRTSLLVSSCGASKAPAYNHFKNFCGNGVFTADGTDWREKRAAVMHALLRPSFNNNNRNHHASFETKLQAELATTAQRLIDSIEEQAIHSQQQQQQDDDGIIKKKDDNWMVQLNIVPILQRATIGLIFRYITDSDPVDIFPQQSVHVASNSGSSCSSSRTSSSSNTCDAASWSGRRDAATEAVTTNVDSCLSTRQEQQQTAHNNNNNNNSSTSLGGRSILLQRYLQSITDIRMIILAQSRSIWFLLPTWCYKTFSAMYRAEEETLGPIRQFAQLACQRALAGSPLHTLQQLPKYSATTTSSSSSTTTTTTFSKNLLDEATTLLFAGQDTSAATLSWTLHLLSLHPQIQNKVAAEVQHVLGNNQDCIDAKDEDLGLSKKVLSKLTFLDAVVKEAMRLYPVAPFVVRKLPFDVVVVDNDKKNIDADDNSSSQRENFVTLPAGTFACIWIYSLHRNPEFWQKPDTFWPERWLLSPPSQQHQQQQQHDNDDDHTRDEKQEPVLDKGITNGAFMPFAVGPRNCVGQPLAYMILRTLLARLLQRFEFRDARCSDCDGNSSSSSNGNILDSVSVDGTNGHSTFRSSSSSKSWSVNNPEAFLKDMQAGFTVLPQNGVQLAIYKRET